MLCMILRLSYKHRWYMIIANASGVLTYTRQMYASIITKK